MRDTEPWVAIYRETIRDLYAFVSRRAGGERQLAEDVTQEAFLRTIARFGRDRSPREPLAWLKTVAGNLLASHYRRNHAVVTDPTALDRLFATTGPESTEEAALLHQGLVRVSRKHRVVLSAFHLDGRSVREISELLSISERAVEGRLKRGREALAKSMKGALR